MEYDELIYFFFFCIKGLYIKVYKFHIAFQKFTFISKKNKVDILQNIRTFLLHVAYQFVLIFWDPSSKF